MPPVPRKLSSDQHHICAERVALLEDLALLTHQELGAIYGLTSPVTLVAQSAVDALEELRLACQEQARTDFPHARSVAADYKPPLRASRSA